jgi:hypothetical protein
MGATGPKDSPFTISASGDTFTDTVGSMNQPRFSVVGQPPPVAKVAPLWRARSSKASKRSR